MSHTHEPAPPWEQLGITEAAYRERERIANQIAGSQAGRGYPTAENSAQAADKEEQYAIENDLDREPSNEELAQQYIAESGKNVHASDCSTSVAPAEIPGPCDCDVALTPAAHMVKPTKPERKTITVDLTDMPEVYTRIKQLAKADDRSMSNWLKRYLRKEHGAAVTK